ncbi:MAG: hypothetical protein HUU55_21770 [Myxococcales bacterium]|nr:hypothetical protein [Myxococcales bacterium]
MLTRLSIRASLVFLPLLGMFLSHSDARATCLTQCEATLKYFDCSEPPPNQWDNKMMLSFDLDCQTCCSAPGGPLTCNAEDPDMSLLSLTHLGQPYDGTFFLSKSTCKSGPLIMFNPALETGPYELLYGNMILAQFTAGAQAGCKTNDQCPKCSVCVSGECKGLGLIVCTQDSDCGKGQMCKIDAEAPCANQCVPIEEGPCKSNEDCPKCSVCVGGECKGLGLIVCTQDSDCGKGQMCKIDPEAPCANQCVPIEEGTCKTDADCPPCWVCNAGECKATGFAVCLSDADCGDGKMCIVDPVAPCNNQCVAKEPGCTNDEDCGSCAVCVAGECKGLGLIMCTSDDDCSQGESCQIDQTDPCKNACVPTAPECTSDADCPVCAVCVLGECKGLGLIVCMADIDCDAGYVCDVSSVADCYNACVPEPTGDDAGSGDDVSASDDAATTDTGNVADVMAGDDTADSGSSGEKDNQESNEDSQALSDSSGNGDNGGNDGSKPEKDDGCSLATTPPTLLSPPFVFVAIFMLGLRIVRRNKNATI